MSSNYAFIPNTLTETTELQTTVELPVFRELAFDFETGQLKTKGGQYYYVDKNEAIKVGYIRHCLRVVTHIWRIVQIMETKSIH